MTYFPPVLMTDPVFQTEVCALWHVEPVLRAHREITRRGLPTAAIDADLEVMAIRLAQKLREQRDSERSATPVGTHSEGQ